MAQNLILDFPQVFSNTGIIGAGYYLYTLITGTSTFQASYTSSALSTPNTNPVVADSAARFSGIWVDARNQYKIILTDGDTSVTTGDIIGNILYTIDPWDGESTSLTDFSPMPTVYMGTTSGTGSAYTLTSDIGLTQYVNTQSFLITYHITNNASPTINIDGLGAISLYYYADDGTPTALPAGTINTAQTYLHNWNEEGTGLIITVLQSKTVIASTSTQGIIYLSSFITITNNTTDADHDIDFSAGIFNFSDGSGQAKLSALTKQIDASWAAGTNAGGLFSGTVAANTWYHCWAIYNPTTGISDAGFDIATTFAPSNLPSGYTKYSYRGTILTDSSVNNYTFNQFGNFFNWGSSFQEWNAASPTSLTFVSTTVPPNIEVIGSYSIANILNNSNTAYMRLIYPNATDATPTNANSQFQFSAAAGAAAISSTCVQVPTNSSRQIGFRSSNSNVGAVINTYGYTIPSNILY